MMTTTGANPAGKRGAHTLVLIGLTCVVLMILAGLFGAPRKRELIQRDTRIQDRGMLGDAMIDNLAVRLEEMRPELVLVGNSMLGEAIGQDQMSRESGMRTAKVWYPGSGSAWWYLLIKNVLTQLENKPRYVAVVFRDNHLTLPQHKVAGKHRIAVDYLAGPEEELLDRLAYHGGTSAPLLLANMYLPLFQRREELKSGVDEWLKEKTADLARVKTKKISPMINSVFGEERMNDQLLHERQLADEEAQDAYRADMRFLPEQTFLPQMIRLLREEGITPLFVRVKRVRDLVPGRQSDELLDYMNKLQAYLASEGVYLIDFTNDNRIGIDHFGKGDHLNRQEGRALFTRLLGEEILRSTEQEGNQLLAGRADKNR